MMTVAQHDAGIHEIFLSHDDYSDIVEDMNVVAVVVEHDDVRFAMMMMVLDDDGSGVNVEQDEVELLIMIEI
jgi:hypothetical protein